MSAVLTAPNTEDGLNAENGFPWRCAFTAKPQSAQPVVEIDPLKFTLSVPTHATRDGGETWFGAVGQFQIFSANLWLTL